MTEVQFLTSVVAKKVSSLDQKVKKRHKKDGSGAKDQLISSTASLQISCEERDGRSLFSLHAYVSYVISSQNQAQTRKRTLTCHFPNLRY